MGTAGTVTLTVSEDGVTGSTVITIRDAPEPILADVERDDLLLYVLPESSALGVYGVQRFNAWGCPIDTASDLGANGTPDGLEDECEPLDINSVAVGELAPLRVAALGGPAVALRLDGIPGDPDGEVAPPGGPGGDSSRSGRPNHQGALRRRSGGTILRRER